MFRKILLTLDGSAMARRALPYVRDLGRDSETGVCILQVIDARDDIVRQLAGDTADLSTADRKRFNERADVLHQLRRDEASRDLEDARRELEAAGVRSVATTYPKAIPRRRSWPPPRGWAVTRSPWVRGGTGTVARGPGATPSVRWRRPSCSTPATPP